MKTNEDVIRNIASRLRGMGHQIPEAISQINDFPYNAFDSLKTELASGHASIRQDSFVYHPEVFDMYARPLEKAVSLLSFLMMWIGPLISLVLVFISSWLWGLAGVFSFVLGAKIGRRNYWRVIFRAAYSSEVVFCLLYAMRQVCITTERDGHMHHWQVSQDESH